MMHSTIKPTEAAPPYPHELITAAARCWRTACDARAPVQQRLYAMLAPDDREMLAPVLASMMALYEVALGRIITVGGEKLSADEHLLLDLLDGSRLRRTCIKCTRSAAAALDCAIRSTRIMIGLVLAVGSQREFAQ